MRIKIISWIVCLVLLMGMAGCQKEGSKKDPSGKTPGSSIVKDIVSENGQERPVAAISMPSQSNEKWIGAAAIMDTSLTDAGFKVVVEFAEDDAQQQIRQLERFVEQKAACLIVAPVLSADLSDALDKAEDAKIPVVFYERLIMGTDPANFYAGFDNLGAGRQIGEYIVQEKKLDSTGSEGKAPVYTIEFFMGDPQDYSAKMVHQGILEILQPYLDNGRLVCRSGRISFEDTAVLYETEETAQKYCEALLDANYLDGHLDIVCTSSDTLTYGIKTALENRGYTHGKDWPLMTGQDAQLEAVKNIAAGYQAMSVFRNSHTLAAKCAEMAIDCANGKKAVPSYLCSTHTVDKDNYKEVLVDSGYYTKKQLP